MSLSMPVYLVLLFLTGVLAIKQWPFLKSADKLIAAMVFIAMLQETVAYACDKLMQNNMFTYHFYSPVEFVIVCLYFNANSRLLGKRNTGIALAVFGVLVSIMNTLLFQPLNTFNSYFVLFEATTIIILCLLSLFETLSDNFLEFRKLSHFWITVALLLYWSCTYTSWGIFSLININDRSMLYLAEWILYCSNLMFYLLIGAVFLNYKKLILSGT